MVDDSIVDEIRPIFDARIDFPEKLEFVEFGKVVNILEDFVKVFIRLQESVAVYVFEQFKEV